MYLNIKLGIFFIANTNEQKHELPAYFWHKLKLNNPTTKQMMAINAIIPFVKPAINNVQDFFYESDKKPDAFSGNHHYVFH